MNTTQTKPRVTSLAPQFLVDDLARSMAYYEKLGFAFDAPWDGFYAIGKLDGLELHLKEAPKNAGERQHRLANEHLDAAAGVDGIEAFYAQCTANGITIISRLQRLLGARRIFTSRTPMAISSPLAVAEVGPSKPKKKHSVKRTKLSFVTAVVVGVGLSAACARPPAPPPPPAAPARLSLMTPDDLRALPSNPPDRRASYGEDSSQFGELRVPAGPGPHPVAILIHGGCFKAAYATTRDLAAMGDALKADAIATWNIEYRRLGQPGGGWPGTYLDVGRAIDHLRALAPEHNLDLGRVVIVGHSAGGHLAMWAAARPRLRAASPLYVASPLRARGVLDLAGPIDVSANIQGYEALCRDSVITTLLGGTPGAVPERYADASAMKQLPLGIPQVIVIGEHEDFLLRSLAEAYPRAAVQAGDPVKLIVIPGAGHFEIASPRASTWHQVESSIRALLDGRLPLR
jgi:acetyl esterase/lipase